jgi:hypothetical protein
MAPRPKQGPPICVPPLQDHVQLDKVLFLIVSAIFFVEHVVVVVKPDGHVLGEAKYRFHLVPLAVGGTAAKIAVRKEIQDGVAFYVAIVVDNLPLPKFVHFAVAELEASKPGGIILRLGLDPLAKECQIGKEGHGQFDSHFAHEGVGIVVFHEDARLPGCCSWR